MRSAGWDWRESLEGFWPKAVRFGPQQPLGEALKGSLPLLEDRKRGPKVVLLEWS